MSLIWPGIKCLFEQAANDGTNDTNIQFKCLMCLPKTNFIKASTTSASNLRTHVKRVHPFKINEFNKCIEKSHKRKRDEDDSEAPAVKQVSLMKSAQGSSKRKVDDAVLRFVVGTGSPFTIVEHQDFKNLLSVCGGSIPPNRKQLMDNLHKSFSQMIQNLKETLNNVTTVCVTADCWTVFRRSYLGMTVHWLDPATLERKSMGMSCKRILGRHTFDILADAIESVLEDFEIKNKTSMMVTDNGSNFVKAFRVFGSADDESVSDQNDESEHIETWVQATEITEALHTNDDFGRLPPHHCCVSHTLNLLATKDAEEALNTSVSYKRMARQVFGKCQALFNKQNMSALAAEIVHKHLGRSGGTCGR